VIGRRVPLPPATAPALKAAIKAICINAAPDDGCLLSDQGCAVLRGQRCGHFETILQVVPPETRAVYADLHPGEVAVSGPSLRTCPDCGGTIRTRERVCDRCRKTRARNGARSRQARRRVMSRVKGKNTPISNEKQGCFSAQSQLFDPG
jgi:hypothetical protein